VANDRIWLVCKTCGEHVGIWKHYPYCGPECATGCEHGSGLCGGYTNAPEKIDPFIAKHISGCHPHGRWDSFDLNGDPGFELLVESALGVGLKADPVQEDDNLGDAPDVQVTQGPGTLPPPGPDDISPTCPCPRIRNLSKGQRAALLIEVIRGV